MTTIDRAIPHCRHGPALGSPPGPPPGGRHPGNRRQRLWCVAGPAADDGGGRARLGAWANRGQQDQYAAEPAKPSYFDDASLLEQMLTRSTLTTGAKRWTAPTVDRRCRLVMSLTYDILTGDYYDRFGYGTVGAIENCPAGTITRSYGKDL